MLTLRVACHVKFADKLLLILRSSRSNLSRSNVKIYTNYFIIIVKWSISRPFPHLEILHESRTLEILSGLGKFRERERERWYRCHDLLFILFVARLIVARNTCRYTDNNQSTQPRSRVNTRVCAISVTSPGVQIIKEWIRCAQRTPTTTTSCNHVEFLYADHRSWIRVMNYLWDKSGNVDK